MWPDGFVIARSEATRRSMERGASDVPGLLRFARNDDRGCPATTTFLKTNPEFGRWQENVGFPENSGRLVWRCAFGHRVLRSRRPKRVMKASWPGLTRPPTRTPRRQDKHLISFCDGDHRGGAAWMAATSAAMTGHGGIPRPILRHAKAPAARCARSADQSPIFGLGSAVRLTGDALHSLAVLDRDFPPPIRDQASLPQRLQRDRHARAAHSEHER